MNGLVRVIRDEPALISEAFRLTLLAVVLLGLKLSDEQTLAIVVAFSAVLAVLTRAMSTPTTKVAEQVDAEVERALTAEAEPMTPEQQRLVSDLQHIISALNGLTIDQQTAVRLAMQRRRKAGTP